MFLCVDTRPNLASQLLYADTRPELRYIYASQLGVPNWRPKLTSRYASRMSYLLRYSLASQLAVCVVARPKLRVPNCVCRYASQLQSVVYCVRYASQLCVYASQLLYTRPNFVYSLYEL